MNVNKLKELIKERALIDAKNDILTEQSQNDQFDILSLNLSDTIDFFNNCSPEELYWVSELFERLSEHFKSKELIECMKRNALRMGIDCSINIEYAKDALNY